MCLQAERGLCSGPELQHAQGCFDRNTQSTNATHELLREDAAAQQREAAAQHKREAAKAKKQRQKQRRKVGSGCGSALAGYEATVQASGACRMPSSSYQRPQALLGSSRQRIHSSSSSSSSGQLAHQSTRQQVLTLNCKQLRQTAAQLRTATSKQQASSLCARAEAGPDTRMPLSQVRLWVLLNDCAARAADKCRWLQLLQSRCHLQQPATPVRSQAPPLLRHLSHRCGPCACTSTATAS